MLELILDVHLCYNIILMSLLKEAVEKAKLVFLRSRKYIWNNKIGEGGGGGNGPGQNISMREHSVGIL